MDDDFELNLDYSDWWCGDTEHCSPEKCDCSLEYSEICYICGEQDICSCEKSWDCCYDDEDISIYDITDDDNYILNICCSSEGSVYPEDHTKIGGIPSE